MCFTWLCTGFTLKYLTRLKKLAKDKQSSLFKFVNYGQSKFYNIGPWLGDYKTAHDHLTI